MPMVELAPCPLALRAWRVARQHECERTRGQLPDQTMRCIVDLRQPADIRQVAAAIGEVMVPLQTAQSYDSFTRAPVAFAPAQGVTGVGGVGDQAATDQYAGNPVDQAGLGSRCADFDSFTHWVAAASLI